ncbi:MAG TPA: metal-dependent hydrolase [Candidatus Dojkabacteria bacterium]|nr:metal-dependent hydrolase [Candidatus Dojkabacteria bacterium]
MIIAHASVSIIANRLLNKKGYKNKGISIMSDILAAIFGIFPDFDFFYLVAFGGSSFDHHSLASHTPIFWIFIFLILRYGLYFISKFFNKDTKSTFNKEIIDTFTLSLLIGTLSHIVADLFTGQIRLLYPFVNYGFSLFGNLTPNNLFAGYIMNPIFGLELIVIITSIYILVVDYFKTKGYKKLLQFFTFFFSILIIVSYGAIYYMTYHKEVFPLDQNGLPNYDQDKDHLIDTSDLDTNNDGKNNLQDVDYKQLVRDANDILNSHKLTGYNRFALKIGGYDSSRIIFGAYAQQDKSAIPVLDNYMLVNHITFNDKRDYMSVFLDYLTHYKSISEKTHIDNLRTISEGNIFFVMDNNDNLVDEGMVLDNHKIAITLPDEKELKVHTMWDLKQAYSDKDYYILIQE